MKLYFAPGTCSLAPHILLEETGLPARYARVDTKTHLTEDGGDFYAINPRGQVPVLELDGGERLTEGPVIAQYIADTAKRHDLMPPAGTIERYRVMEWQNYVTSEIHKSFTPLFNPALQSLDDDVKDRFRAILRKKFEWLDGQLEDKQYLTGDTFTAADAYLFTVSNWSKFAKLDLSGLDNLGAYRERVAARPAVHAAMKAEGLLG